MSRIVTFLLLAGTLMACSAHTGRDLSENRDGIESDRSGRPWIPPSWASPDHLIFAAGWRNSNDFRSQERYDLEIRSLKQIIPGVQAPAVVLSEESFASEIKQFLSTNGAENRVQVVSVPNGCKATQWIRDSYTLVLENTLSNSNIPNRKIVTSHSTCTLEALSDYFQIPIEVATGVTHEGGDVISNGDGLCISTRRIFSLPNDGEEAIDAFYSKALGCKKTIFVEFSDYIHIDGIMQFAGIGRNGSYKLLVGQYAEDDPRFGTTDIIQAMREEADQFGKPLEVIPVPMPPPSPIPQDVSYQASYRREPPFRTHLNFMVDKGRILVPVFDFTHDGDEERQSILNNRQDLAIQTIRKAMPGFKVEPRFVSDEDVASGGIFHCRSNAIF